MGSEWTGTRPGSVLQARAQRRLQRARSSQEPREVWERPAPPSTEAQGGPGPWASAEGLGLLRKSCRVQGQNRRGPGARAGPAGDGRKLAVPSSGSLPCSGHAGPRQRQPVPAPCFQGAPCILLKGAPRSLEPPQTTEAAPCSWIKVTQPRACPSGLYSCSSPHELLPWMSRGGHSEIP